MNQCQQCVLDCDFQCPTCDVDISEYMRSLPRLVVSVGQVSPGHCMKQEVADTGVEVCLMGPDQLQALALMDYQLQQLSSTLFHAAGGVG